MTSRGSRPWLPPVLLLLSLIGLTGWLFYRGQVTPAPSDEWSKAFWATGPCPWRERTGQRCGGCGTTRSTQALIAGRWGEAFYFHALWTIALPALGLGSIIRLSWGLMSPPTPTRMALQPSLEEPASMTGLPARGRFWLLISVGTMALGFCFMWIRNQTWWPLY